MNLEMTGIINRRDYREMKKINIMYLFLILLGNTLYALSVVMFILPNGLLSGGTTGMGITLDHYFSIPIEYFVFVFNGLMFVVGALMLGMKFALTTLVSSFYYPIILGVFKGIPALSHVTEDKMLATVCGGFLIGVGIGIVIRAGASTGGMDIPPLVLNKKFGIPVSVSMYVFDFVILIMQMLFSDKEECIYGILMIVIYTFILDKTLLLGTKKMEVKIVSDHSEEITKIILEKVDRGVTLLHAETGYLKKEQKMVMTIVSNRELMVLKQMVQEIDPSAFIIIGHVNEVKGRGFSLDREYKN